MKPAAVQIVKKSISFMCVPRYSRSLELEPQLRSIKSSNSPSQLFVIEFQSQIAFCMSSKRHNLCLVLAAPMKAGRQKNGKCRRRFSDSSGALGFQGVQIRAQFAAGHTRDPLNFEHSQRRNFLPLGNCLFGDVQGGGELGQAAGGIDGAI